MSCIALDHGLVLGVRMDAGVQTYCLDRDLHPKLKEGLCKKSAPNAATQRLLTAAERPAIKKFEAIDADKEGRGLAALLGGDAGVRGLVAFADQIGALMLYRHQGFPNSARQLRAGGLGAVALAQALGVALRAGRQGEGVGVPNVSASAGDQQPAPGTCVFCFARFYIHH